jgi:predicted anti-sigma-YlaC factor YlaD
MSKRFCTREGELLEALERGYVAPELLAHIDMCASCRELHAVAGALLDDRAHVMAEAALPSAGTLWWRMQMRRHREAQAAARRSLLIGQAATLLVAIILIASFLGTRVATGVRELFASFGFGTPLLLAIALAVGTWLLAAPLAGYVVTRQK